MVNPSLGIFNEFKNTIYTSIISRNLQYLTHNSVPTDNFGYCPSTSKGGDAFWKSVEISSLHLANHFICVPASSEKIRTRLTDSVNSFAKRLRWLLGSKFLSR